MPIHMCQVGPWTMMIQTPSFLTMIWFSWSDNYSKSLFFYKCWKFRKMLVLYQKIVSSKWALWINQNSIYHWHDIDDHEKNSDEHIFHSPFKKFHFSRENLLDFINSDGLKTKYAMIWYPVLFLSHFHQSRVNKH